MPTKTVTTTTVVETVSDVKTVTRVTFVLDKSGSMEGLVSATIEGYNAYIGTLKASGENILFTQVQFDTMSVITSPTLPVHLVPLLNRDNYNPQGGTPLVDAAYKAIMATEQAARPHEKVIICIQTDGQENASVEYKMPDLHQLIKRLSAIGWQFNFMGTGIDAYAQGAAMGIQRSSTMTYGQSVGETRSAFMSNATNSAGFASGALGGTGYSTSQKAAAGDPTAKGGQGIAPGGNAGVAPSKVTPIKPLVDAPKID